MRRKNKYQKRKERKMRKKSRERKKKRKENKRKKKSEEMKEVTPILEAVSDDDDDHKGSMSSLRKLLEKKKLVKSLERTLTKVLDKMQKTIHRTITNPDLQTKAKELVKYFDEEFTTFSKIALVQAQENNDASLFDTIFKSVRNDRKTLDMHIKELRKRIDEGKKLYG